MAQSTDHKIARLRWIQSPVRVEGEAEHQGDHGLHDNSTDLTHQNSKTHLVNSSQGSSARDTQPQFKKYHESTNIELFFDLFFVANLTTFASLHDINNLEMLKASIGFFCILWFTWCQVSLFDVRFVADSVIDRATKAVHLGVMVGFAVVGPNFSTSKRKGEEVDVFKIMCKIVFSKADETPLMSTKAVMLLVSRFVLAFQYLMVMWHVRKFCNTKLPFLLLAGLNLMAGGSYVAAFYALQLKMNTYAHASFYAIGVCEIALNIAISSYWKVANFRDTHLVQRCSLLTLIILGEGIILITKSVSKIVQNTGAWDSETVGLVVGSVTTIYILYMLYFDALPSHDFGCVRQQVWGFVHFPFHLALVLFMQGLAQFVIWNKMVRIANLFINGLYSIPLATYVADSNYALLTSDIRHAIHGVFEAFPPKNKLVFAAVNADLALISSYANSTVIVNPAVIEGQIQNLAATVIRSIFESYKFELPQGKNSTAPATPRDELMQDVSVIELILNYFFVAAGVTLILLGLLNFLTLRKGSFTKEGLKHPGILVRFSSYLVVGIGLVLLPFVLETGTSGTTLYESTWLLPVVTIAIIFVLLVQYLGLPRQKDDWNWGNFKTETY